MAEIEDKPNGGRFQGAIAAWRTIDLSSLVSELDGTTSEIVEHQKETLVSRKDLAQQTKDFRKLDDASKLTEIKALLKAYQTFIDLLTNHGKQTSSAFLRVYSAISEAPDPYPLLEASVDSMLVCDESLPQITVENERLQESLQQAMADLEVSTSLLDKERSGREQLESNWDDTVKSIQASWQAVMDEKRDNWESKERTMQEKLEGQERLLVELKANLEVSQRLGPEDESQKAPSASLAELDIISSDLERTTQRLAEMQARNEQLQTRLAQASSSRAPDSETEVARLRLENSSLLHKLQNTRLTKDAEARKDETRLRSLEKEVKSAQAERESLRQRVEAMRDYREVKQELEIFKTLLNQSIELSAFDEPSESESLEQMLLGRNKKLNDDLAVLRVAQQELRQESDDLRETCARTQEELERSKSLNASLESDLVTVQQEVGDGLPSSAMSVAASRYPVSTRRGRGSPTSSIISAFEPRNAVDAFRAGEAIGGGSGILPMVQAQRDRFKQKNVQLEEELGQQHRTVSSLRQEVASLQKDNLNLYEKSRYVSTYSRASASTYAAAPHRAMTIQMNDEPMIDRYKSTYEANLSPFAAFRGREHGRALRHMSLLERVIFSFTRIVLANRTSRNLFALYCVGLHMLVFGMLFGMHSADVVPRAQDTLTAQRDWQAD